MGKVPAASTIAAHNTALNYVFRKALSLNYIQYMPRLISNDGDSTKKRRRYFNDIEMRQLQNGMTAWAKKDRRGRGFSVPTSILARFGGGITRLLGDTKVFGGCWTRMKRMFILPMSM